MTDILHPYDISVYIFNVQAISVLLVRSHMGPYGLPYSLMGSNVWGPHGPASNGSPWAL